MEARVASTQLMCTTTSRSYRSTIAVEAPRESMREALVNCINSTNDSILMQSPKGTLHFLLHNSDLF